MKQHHRYTTTRLILFVGLVANLSALQAFAQIRWQQIGHGLSTPTVRMFTANARDEMFAATESGIVKLDSATLTGRVVHPFASSALITLRDGAMISFGDGI